MRHSMLYYHSAVWSGIEVVITGLTRNQLGRKVSWVRIPPAPPSDKGCCMSFFTIMQQSFFLCSF